MHQRKINQYLTLYQNWNRTPVYFKLAVSASYSLFGVFSLLYFLSLAHFLFSSGSILLYFCQSGDIGKVICVSQNWQRTGWKWWRFFQVSPGWPENVDDEGLLRHLPSEYNDLMKYWFPVQFHLLGEFSFFQTPLTLPFDSWGILNRLSVDIPDDISQDNILHLHLS